MAEDLVAQPWAFGAVQAVPLAEVPAEHVALAPDRGPDPLECGFLLAAGVLAPLPPRLRLPHDDDEGDEDDADPVRT